MKVLGFRCWPEKFSFVVADGEASAFKIIEAGIKNAPADLTRPGVLHWFTKEIRTLVQRYQLRHAAYKRIEGAAQKNASLLERAEVEGVIRATLYENGCRDVKGYDKRQAKAATGYGGSAKDVVEVISTTPLNAELGKPTEEAALAAFSYLSE